jgi:hypothetical protein
MMRVWEYEAILVPPRPVRTGSPKPSDISRLEAVKQARCSSWEARNEVLIPAVHIIRIRDRALENDSTLDVNGDKLNLGVHS